ncbi:hypothetical protein WDU94_014618 [Cyamophila willieti]
MIYISVRLKTRLTAIIKYAISSVLILMFIIATLSWIDSYTDEAYYLINHQIYLRRNLRCWNAKEIQIERVIQIVCLPIPCTLIFVIYEFLVEGFDLIKNYVSDVGEDRHDDVKINNNIKQLKSELMTLYDIHDNNNHVEKTQDFVNELRMNQLDSILNKLRSAEEKQEYLKNLVTYNKYVIECNSHCQYIEDVSLL